MLVTREFIAGCCTVGMGIFAVGTLLTSPTPLDAVIVYQKESLPIVESSFLVASSTAVFEAQPLDILALESQAEPAPQPQLLSATENALQSEIEKMPEVPFFSQFNDITKASWKKVGCGIASLAMLIEYHKPGTVSVDDLLEEGIQANAYLNDAGWTYAGLIGISEKYGITGKTHDYGTESMDAAYAQLLSSLESGPLMASVHYTFQKSNPIPHLVIINGIKDDVVFYNDPAEEQGGGTISSAQFKSAWKKRYIEFYPI